jgi:AGZA family xanthine/uracil permease-like MFS transporter
LDLKSNHPLPSFFAATPKKLRFLSLWHGIAKLRDTFGPFDSRFFAFYTSRSFFAEHKVLDAIFVPFGKFVKTANYQWAAPGDINAFFGLMLDNIAGLVLAVGILTSVFSFPVDFALRYMVPGTAIGVLIGDLLFFWLAFRYARRSGRSDVTAMPLGLDTPSTIGMAYFVVGPAFKIASSRLAAEGSLVEAEAIQFAAAIEAWHIGICAIFIMGLIKLVLSFGSNWIQNVFPRAGLLGSLAAIALVLIAFTQMPKIAANPIVGFASLAIVSVTLIGRGRLPWNIPGALAAVLFGCLVWYGLMASEHWFATQLVPPAGPPIETVWLPVEWLRACTFEWFSAMDKALGYLPYVVPFALATVIGGIDCSESAASVGDRFNTNTVIGIEAVATILAACCGGVLQTTPYIGHPAYKAMGGRAAYTLATALFVGGAGAIGYFGLLFKFIPEAALLPILIFIGVEITAQSFHATPKRHYAALAIACIPAMAKLVTIYLGQYGVAIQYEAAIEQGLMTAGDQAFLGQQTLLLNVLAGGFILTSLVWAAATAKMIDRRYYSASIYLAVGGMFVLFGVMHSPLPGDQMYLPWSLSDPALFDIQARQTVFQFALAYLVMAVVMFLVGSMTKDTPIDNDTEFEKLGY